MNTIPGVVSQLPGSRLRIVGDIDECWVAATIWAALCADPSAVFPSVQEFRAAANNPDRPGPTGGDLDDIIRGASQTWPYMVLKRYQSPDWMPYIELLEHGWSSSLATLSAALPSRLQFGHRGPHQVGVVMHKGDLRLANPLAHDEATPGWITDSDLRHAAKAVANGTVLSCLFKPLPQPSGAEMINATGNDLHSRRLARIVVNAPLLDAPGGARIGADAKAGRAYPFIGVASGYRAILVPTALPYEDGIIRPTVLYVVASAVALEDNPQQSSGDVVHTVTVQVDGAEVSKTEV